MPPAAGDPAPDFGLLDTDRQPVALAGLRGTPVLLVFFPFAFSPLCTGELRQLSTEHEVYTRAGVHVLAVSTDPVYSLRAWREQQGLSVPLLSDFWPHGAAAAAYGVLDQRAGMAVRATFLVDAAGQVAFAEVNGPGDVREQTGWQDAVTRL